MTKSTKEKIDEISIAINIAKIFKAVFDGLIAVLEICKIYVA